MLFGKLVSIGQIRDHNFTRVASVEINWFERREAEAEAELAGWVDCASRGRFRTRRNPFPWICESYDTTK
jgi:hypothetical protein